MKKTDWLKNTSVDQISTWDKARCLDYLLLSETSQRKLLSPSGTENVGQVKELISERLKALEEETKSMKDVNFTKLVNVLNLQQFVINHLINFPRHLQLPPVRQRDHGGLAWEDIEELDKKLEQIITELINKKSEQSTKL